MALAEFGQEIAATPDPLATLRQGLIGEGATIPTSGGPRPMIYADYVASGRALRQVEEFVAGQVLPYYGNCHSSDSYCGAYITALREEARSEVARLTGAGEDCAVIFCGSGATAGINRLVDLLGLSVADGDRQPVVLIGPYEHHSNTLPWRESGAKVIEIPEQVSGGPDMAALATALEENAEAPLIVGSFSAASNVSGVLTDIDAVTGLLKAHGALSVWDYACGAPYLPISMATGSGLPVDAIVFSPHKFPGGPAASGVLIVRREAVSRERPSVPGGGTVTFVSPWAHDYVSDLSEREEGGTPAIIGDIRVALAMLAKEAVGEARIAEREAAFNRRALARWRENPHLQLLGAGPDERLPIFSFLVRRADGSIVDSKLFTRTLSDRTGIQTRAGCSCAGAYGHTLLGIDRDASDVLRAAIRRGESNARPGWVRLNFSYLMTDETADFVIDAIDQLAREMANAADAA